MLALPLLVDAFVQGAQVDPSADMTTRKRKGELHFLSSVFANLSVVSIYAGQDSTASISSSLDASWARVLFDSSSC